LYRKVNKKDGRSVYKQNHVLMSKCDGDPSKLFSDRGYTPAGVWRITWDHHEFFKAATPSESPTSVKWQYKDYGAPIWETIDNDKKRWRDDPTLTVTGLSEKLSEFEVTISLSQDIPNYIRDLGVAGVYRARADGKYRYGRQVLHHSGGLYTLSVWAGLWRVQAGVEGDSYLESGSAPSMCPADPRAARNESRGVKHWKYWSNQSQEWTVSSGISVKASGSDLEQENADPDEAEEDFTM